MFLFTLSRVWFKPSSCTLVYRKLFLASSFMSPPRPSKSPPMQECVQPYFKVEVLWTTPKALLNLEHFTEQFRARLHRPLSRQSRAGSSLWQKGRALQGRAGGAGGNTESHPGSDFCSLHQPMQLSQHHFGHLQNPTCAIVVYFHFHAAKCNQPVITSTVVENSKRKLWDEKKKYIKLVWHEEAVKWLWLLKTKTVRSTSQNIAPVSQN